MLDANTLPVIDSYKHTNEWLVGMGEVCYETHLFPPHLTILLILNY